VELLCETSDQRQELLCETSHEYKRSSFLSSVYLDTHLEQKCIKRSTLDTQDKRCRQSAIYSRHATTLDTQEKPSVSDLL